jgi:nucleotide-binding universal stress UspA family protein
MSEPSCRIVVAYDGSPQALVAVVRAIGMARAGFSRLTIVTVYHPAIVRTAAPVVSPMVGPETPPQPPREAERKALKEVLQQAVETAEGQTIAT